MKPSRIVIRNGFVVHRMGKTAAEFDSEIIGWECVICGEWINEFKPTTVCVPPVELIQ